MQETMSFVGTMLTHTMFRIVLYLTGLLHIYEIKLKITVKLLVRVLTVQRRIILVQRSAIRRFDYFNIYFLRNVSTTNIEFHRSQSFLRIKLCGSQRVKKNF